MIPYVEQPSWTIGSWSIDAFTVLVVISVIVGFEGAVRRSSRYGFRRGEAADLVMWMILAAFITSHLFDTLLYFPERVRADPLELLRIWGSMSSYGGVIGGLLVGAGIFRYRGYSLNKWWGMLDTLCWAFPFGWIFGRLGCSLAHDHIGIRSDHWLAVRFPDGPRFDLGLLELFLTLFICALYLVLDRRPRATGFYAAVFFILYGSVRFGLDMLRVEDARYLGWTPGQFASVAVVIFGLGVAVLVVRRGIAPSEIS